MVQRFALQTGVSLSAYSKVLQVDSNLIVFQDPLTGSFSIPVPQSIQYNSEEPHFPQLRSSQLRIFMGGKCGTSLRNYSIKE